MGHKHPSDREHASLRPFENSLEQTANSADEVSLKTVILKIRHWYKYLISKFLFIAVAGLIGAIIGLIYSVNTKPLYKAELSFALEDDKGGSAGLGSAMGLASQFGFDLGGTGGGAFSGDNLLELMKSRTMIVKTLLKEVKVNGKNQTLADLYIDFNKLRKDWKSPELNSLHFPININPEELTRSQDSLLGEFHRSLIKNNLVVDKVDKKLSIILVKVHSKNEIFSMHFAEVLVKEVSDFYVETKTKKSVQNLGILQYQTDSVRRALNSAISGVAISADINPNPNPSRQILRVPSQRRQVDVQANQAILTELVKNLEISKVSLRKETPLIQIIDKPIMPLEVQKVSATRSILIGFILFGILATFFLVSKRIYLEAIAS